MVPRIKIIAIEKSASITKVIKITQKYQDSRFPVYENNIDNIVGFVHIKDIYKNLVSDDKITSIKDTYKNFLRINGQKSLSDLKIIRKIPHVKETDRIDDVLILLQRKGIHIAVVDEGRGGTAGIVALEDIVENLVGDIKDEFDESGVNVVTKT
jgi:CBS domain containing-hemolysin-like protein